MEKDLTSQQNPLVKRLVKLRNSRSYREKEGRLVVSGKKVLIELVGKVTFHTLLVTHREAIPPKIKAEAVYTASEGILKKVSGLTKADDPVAEVSLPPPTPLTGFTRLLVLDNLRDPGNLGTLLRTALAFDWDGVYLVEGTVDPFNEKALRAGRGAIFDLPYRWGSEEELRTLIEKESAAVYIADLDGEVMKGKGEKPLALILGNEAHGPHLKTMGSWKKIRIPMPGGTESLNVSVAGALFLFSL